MVGHLESGDVKPVGLDLSQPPPFLGLTLPEPIVSISIRSMVHAAWCRLH
jgi:hypothetical protein